MNINQSKTISAFIFCEKGERKKELCHQLCFVNDANDIVEVEHQLNKVKVVVNTVLSP